MLTLHLLIVFELIVIQSAFGEHEIAPNDPYNSNIQLYCLSSRICQFLGAFKRTTQINVKLAKVHHNNITALLFDQFSRECKDFTEVMSLRFHLQDFLLQRNTTFECDIAIRFNMTTFYSTLLYLQNIASLLDDMAVQRQRRRCIDLSTSQYKMMYYSIFGTDCLLESILMTAGRFVLQNKKINVEHCDYNSTLRSFYDNYIEL